MDRLEEVKELWKYSKNESCEGIVLLNSYKQKSIDWLISETERLRKEKGWLIKEVRYGSFQTSDEICERMHQALKESK